MKTSPIQQRGLGSFPEFAGLQLRSIQHNFVEGENYPEQYEFIFVGKDSILRHVHALPYGVNLDPGNYRFIGLVVSKAQQFLSENRQQTCFEFIFDEKHSMRFYYD